MMLPSYVHFGLPWWLSGKESACNAGDLGLIPGLGRSLGRGHDSPLQFSCLENLHGQRSLVGYSPWGRKESDTTEWLSTTRFILHDGEQRFLWVASNALNCRLHQRKFFLHTNSCDGMGGARWYWDILDDVSFLLHVLSFLSTKLIYMPWNLEKK